MHWLLTHMRGSTQKVSKCQEGNRDRDLGKGKNERDREIRSPDWSPGCDTQAKTWQA